MTIEQFPRAAMALASAFSVLLAVSGCSGLNSPVQTPQKLTDAPTILIVVPQTNGVGTNRSVAVVFSKPMDPASINGGSFMVAGVTGSVAYDAANRIASFKPSTDFAPNTMFNATITTGAKDTSGTPLAAPFNFSFTTRATADTSPPAIVAINVAAGATCVPLDQKISVTFDEQMDSLTINPSTFFIEGVAGTVTFNVLSEVATFTPSANLATNTTFTFTVTTGAKDMGGVPIAAPFHLTFTTGPCQTGGVP